MNIFIFVADSKGSSSLNGIVQEAAQNKQVIITTHNPEFLKYANLNNILLVSRDKAGFSQISRPAKKDTIKAFLDNEMGMDELFIENLLEIPE